MKYYVDIEGLPKGWKPVAYRAPLLHENYLSCNRVETANSNLLNFWLVVEKIQPRMIVLEETWELRQAVKGEFCEEGDVFFRNQHESTMGKYKIWREVK